MIKFSKTSIRADSVGQLLKNMVELIIGGATFVDSGNDPSTRVLELKLIPRCLPISSSLDFELKHLETTAMATAAMEAAATTSIVRMIRYYNTASVLKSYYQIEDGGQLLDLECDISTRVVTICERFQFLLFWFFSAGV